MLFSLVDHEAEHGGEVNTAKGGKTQRALTASASSSTFSRLRSHLTEAQCHPRTLFFCEALPGLPCERLFCGQWSENAHRPDPRIRDGESANARTERIDVDLRVKINATPRTNETGTHLDGCIRGQRCKAKEVQRVEVPRTRERM